MKLSRKDFLKLGGASLLAFCGERLWGVLAAAGQTIADSSRLVVQRKHLGMLIDTRACGQHPNCAQCIEACDKVHNIPRFADRAHEVKWIWTESFDNVFASQETPFMPAALKEERVPVLCNHCDNPPCVRVCPTGATWKREEDGIVMMDWHRCIGCRYCMAACPYGSRSFNWLDPRPNLTEMNPDFPTRTKGVVEKCTFCPERLAKGQLPACVEACPGKALVFGDLNDPDSEIRKRLGAQYTIRRKPELGTGPNIYYIV
ncbi:MAG: 4Fe-4S dicluster domain-containing protein [Candidatus Binataceae bacterium]